MYVMFEPLFLKKLQMELPDDPSTPPLGVHSREPRASTGSVCTPGSERPDSQEPGGKGSDPMPISIQTKDRQHEGFT